MKTYTQDQYDRAKLRAYRKGQADAKEEMTIDDVIENADQVKSWNKYGEAEFNWGIVLVIVLTLGVVASIMIANNHAINNF